MLIKSSLKKYDNAILLPKRISNIDYLYDGKFIYLIYEKSNDGIMLKDVINNYLQNKFKSISYEMNDNTEYFVVQLKEISDDTKKIINTIRKNDNIHYRGNLFVSQADLKNPIPFLVFQRSETIPRELYDPKIVVNKITTNNIKLNVISDNLIIGGTKTRAILKYLSSILNDNINTLIYLGASNGYAQVAFAYSLYLLKSNIKLIIYFQKTKLYEANKLKSISKYIYHNIEYIEVAKPFREIWSLIDEKLNDTTLLIPFGLNDPIYRNYFYESLNYHLVDYKNKIKRLWIVGGSGTLFTTLYNILVDTFFNVVQVGKDIKLDDEHDRVKLYKSSYKLYLPIEKNIPYPTLKSYDGKIWEFSDEFKDGDYIWNVGGVHAIV